MAIIVHGVVVNEYAGVYESSASERVGCFQYCRVDFCYVGLFDQDVDLAVKQEAEENFVLNTPPQLPSQPLTTDSDCTVHQYSVAATDTQTRTVHPRSPRRTTTVFQFSQNEARARVDHVVLIGPPRWPPSHVRSNHRVLNEYITGAMMSGSLYHCANDMVASSNQKGKLNTRLNAMYRDVLSGG